jgi:spoIIIJ-associated protein
MKSVEAEAGSIDEAIEKALARLGVSRDQAAIEIVSNATRGLFGFGGKKAVVRATLRAPIEIDGEPEASAPRAAPPAPRAPADARRAVSPPTRRASEARRPSASRPHSKAPRQATSGTAASGEDLAPDEHEEGAPLDAKTLERAREVLTETVRLMQTEATVRLVNAPEGPELCIDGDTSGLLIGRRGQTLDALEYVINRVASRDAGETAHLVVDSQGYRARRREALRDLARRLAERARKRGAAVPMNPMSPRDRRVVHLALQDDASVETRSAGKGHFRKLLIVPSGGRRAKK